MKRIKQFFLLMLLSLCSIASHAYDFEVDGIYYDVISLSDLTASVTTGDNEYEGDVVIPSHVAYHSKDFTVTTCDLSNFLKVNSLTIPKSVTNISTDRRFKGEVCLSSWNALMQIVGNLTSTEIVTLMPDYSGSMYGLKYNNHIRRLNILASTPVAPLSIDEFNHQQLINLEVRVPQNQLDDYKKTEWNAFWNLQEYNKEEPCRAKIYEHSFDFEVDGIYYNVVDFSEHTVEVTHSGVSPHQYIMDTGNGRTAHFMAYESYQDKVVVPETINFQNRMFTVVQIGEAAFLAQNKIREISLPPSINNIITNPTYNNWGKDYINGKNAGAFSGCKFSIIEISNDIELSALSYYILAGTFKEESALSNLNLLKLSRNFRGTLSSNFSRIQMESLICNASCPITFSEGTHFSQDQFLHLKVYVPEKSYDAYANADVWKEFWNLTAMKSVKSVTFDVQDITLKPNEKRQLHATVLPADAFNSELKWSSLNPDVAEVDNEGNVTGKKKGDAVIVATTTDGSNLSAICDVHVDCRVESIKLNTNKIMLEPSKTYRLSATVLPTDAFVKDVVWKSMDESIASVDAQGNVTANAIGKTDIIVSTTDGSNLSDICEVIVMNMSNIEVDGIFYNVGTDGAVVVPNPNGTKYSGVIEIPSNINIPELGMLNVISIDANAFKNANLLTKITLPTTIESVELGTFSGCSSLEYVGIENGSKLSANLDDVFAGLNVKELYLGADKVSFNNNSMLLSGLKSIVVGNSVTKLPNVAVCSSNLERFVVESGTNSILEPSDYCSKSYTQLYCNTVRSNNIYYSFGYLVTITHLKPLADLMENKTIKHIYIGREVEGLDIEKPTYETKPTSAGSTYQGYGFKDEFRYQYQELIAKTTYTEIVASSIALNKNSVNIIEGGKETLIVSFTPNDVTEKSLSWTSSNDKVAMVSDGIVTAIALGEADITVTTSNGKTATCRVTVTEDFDKTAYNFRLNYTAILSKTTSTVLSTDASAIKDALDAYDKLSAAAKDKLTAEKSLLDSLKTKAEEIKAAEEADAAATAEANKFKTDNATILGKTTSTVASSDIPTINTAMDDYSKLSEAAKAKLTNGEKVLLDALKTKAEELKAAEEADAAATAEANKFKADNAAILGKITSTVASSDIPAINTAMDDYSKLSEAAKAKLTNGEKALLDALKTKAEELKAAEEADAAATAEANKFKADNAAILGKTTATVASVDLPTINLALGYYEKLSDAAKAKLTGGEKDLLDSLKTKAEELKASEDADAVAAGEAEKFKTDNAEILGKTIDTVSSSDLPAITFALDYYDKLSDAAKAKLTGGEKDLLDNLKAKAEELKAVEDADAAATAEADKFKTDNATILGKSTSTVTSSDIEAIKKALDDYGKLSDAAKEKLTDGEKTKLDSLKEKAEELKAEEEADAAAEKEADDFYDNHADILTKTVDEITADDKDAIDKALEDYDKLSDAAKDKLTNGEKALLDSLKDKVESIITSISNVSSYYDNEKWYDLSGKVVNKGHKGFAIINGKKVFVK